MSINHIFVNVGRCLLKYAIYDKYKCKWVYNITLLIYTILQVNKTKNRKQKILLSVSIIYLWNLNQTLRK